MNDKCSYEIPRAEWTDNSFDPQNGVKHDHRKLLANNGTIILCVGLLRENTVVRSRTLYKDMSVEEDQSK